MDEDSMEAGDLMALRHRWQSRGRDYEVYGTSRGPRLTIDGRLSPAPAAVLAELLDLACRLDLEERALDAATEREAIREAERWRALAGKALAWILRSPDLPECALAPEDDPCRCGRSELLANPDGAAALAEWTALRERAEASDAEAERWHRVATELQERCDRQETALGAVEAWRGRAEAAETELASCADLLNCGLRETGAGPEVTPADLRPGIRSLWWRLNETKGKMLTERERAEAAEEQASGASSVAAALRKLVAEKDAALAAAGEALQPFAEALLPEQELASGPPDNADIELFFEYGQLRAAMRAVSAPALARAAGLDAARQRLVVAFRRYRTSVNPTDRLEASMEMWAADDALVALEASQ